MRPLTLTLAVAALAAVAAAAPAEKYTTKFDYINVDDVLRNDRLVDKYVECLLAVTDVRCTPDGKELRKSIPDALETRCEKCSETQRTGTDKVIRHLVKERPEDWTKLKAKYDPEGKYAQRYEDEAEERGIKV